MRRSADIAVGKLKIGKQVRLIGDAGLDADRQWTMRRRAKQHLHETGKSRLALAMKMNAGEGSGVIVLKSHARDLWARRRERRAATVEEKFRTDENRKPAQLPIAKAAQDFAVFSHCFEEAVAPGRFRKSPKQIVSARFIQAREVFCFFDIILAAQFRDIGPRHQFCDGRDRCFDKVEGVGDQKKPGRRARHNIELQFPPPRHGLRIGRPIDDLRALGIAVFGGQTGDLAENALALMGGFGGAFTDLERPRLVAVNDQRFAAQIAGSGKFIAKSRNGEHAPERIFVTPPTPTPVGQVIAGTNILEFRFVQRQNLIVHCHRPPVLSPRPILKRRPATMVDRPISHGQSNPAQVSFKAQRLIPLTQVALHVVF
ncbi:MAG: hypothetical protein ABSA13_14400 [Beijerinckiaceae bacterium]